MTFSLDQSLSPEKVKQLIVRCVERLLERDNPSLETIKMQIDYDTVFRKNENEAQKQLRLRNKVIAAHKMSIVEVEMDEANDFEALTTLYRKIFKFLLDFAPNAKSHDRTVEREVAAALESVFPRIGLKAFVQLSLDEKGTQLLELARIVLGIRLFNRDQGRGGVGIDGIDKEGSVMVNSLMEEIDQEVEFFADACAKYQKAIVRALLKRRKQEIDFANEAKRQLRIQEAYKAEAKDTDEDPAEQKQAKSLERESKAEGASATQQPTEPLVSNYLVDRWSHELANRRQYLGFLRVLQDEVQSIQEKIIQLCELIQNELISLRSLVGSKSSVPKEVVYPRFDSLGSTWVQLFEEFCVLNARRATFQSLCKYRLSFNPTLAERFYADNRNGLEEKSMSSIEEVNDPVLVSQAKTLYDENDTRSLQILMDSKEQSKSSAAGGAAGSGYDENADSGATLLSVQTTADFMLLPLELQGFCPWTLVHARGLLVPGKPNLGVVRYENMYYVCDHEAGLRAFIQNPSYYLNIIREKALNNPEYINLLRMHKWFPTASIARLMDDSSSEPDQRVGFGGKPVTRDASTETPVHFIERHIDNNYHWNEWELRRRALKIVNLKNCVTTSQQTDNSHFRRDNETQVYELREKDTQTRREKGTNPPIVTTYIAGLRGRAGENAGGALSKYVREEKAAQPAPRNQKAEHKADPGARIVRLELDL